jgi:hypothetical protein
MKRFVIFSALLLSMTMVAQEEKYKVENNMVVSIITNYQHRTN